MSKVYVATLKEFWEGIMEKKFNIMVADPAGNITIFVLDKTDRSEYKDVAIKLLDLEDLSGEQVAFVKSIGEDGSIPEMEMCGLEFCGNATRAFAMYIAGKREIEEYTTLKIRCSGAENVLSVEIDPKTGFSRMAMPNPTLIEKLDMNLSIGQVEGHLVMFEGIAHVVLDDVKASRELFDEIKKEIIKDDMMAFGVMFCNYEHGVLTPVVYVKDVDTTYFEGSCASGTIAATIAFSQEQDSGTSKRTFRQPAGNLAATIYKDGSKIKNAFIEGIIELSEEMTVKI